MFPPERFFVGGHRQLAPRFGFSCYWRLIFGVLFGLFLSSYASSLHMYNLSLCSHPRLFVSFHPVYDTVLAWSGKRFLVPDAPRIGTPRRSYNSGAWSCRVHCHNHGCSGVANFERGENMGTHKLRLALFFFVLDQTGERSLCAVDCVHITYDICLLCPRCGITVHATIADLRE